MGAPGADDVVLLVLEKHGVRPEQRAEIAACRTAAEIQDWVSALPFYIAETGGKIVRSEAAILFWALRQRNGPNPRPLPANFLARRERDRIYAQDLEKERIAEQLALTGPNDLEQRRATASTTLSSAEIRANMPEFIRRKVSRS